MTEIKILKEKIRKAENQLLFDKLELMRICPHENVEIDSTSHYCGFDEYTTVCLDCGKQTIKDQTV